ncbi:hypothetical protein CYY_006963 [Polysphondylium violaceum]|uniref:N-acetyltransferase domain-containing protein n=1 Tax=Polysphondylium violaceum TaxID=133409 RepID=A0A8J4PPU7_9MYCE|nr:hypothetical protein CYY_006963 [Polysphondylium violaceum]
MSTDTTELYKITLDQVEKVVDINTTSFALDPYLNYMFYEITDPETRMMFIRNMQAAFINQTIHFNESYSLSDQLQSVMLMIPPENPWPEDLWDVFTESQKTLLLERNLTTTYERFMKLEEFFSERFCQYDGISGYYLLVLSTNINYRKQGLASKLLNQVFAKLDREQKKCYIECTDASNIPFYKKHGFEIIGHESLPLVGDVPLDKVPQITFLSRPPQSIKPDLK